MSTLLVCAQRPPCSCPFLAGGGFVADESGGCYFREMEAIGIVVFFLYFVLCGVGRMVIRFGGMTFRLYFLGTARLQVQKLGRWEDGR